MAKRNNLPPARQNVINTRMLLEGSITIDNLDSMLQNIDVLPRFSDLLNQYINAYNDTIRGEEDEDDLYITTEKLGNEARISRAKAYDAIKGKYIPEKDALLRIAFTLQRSSEDTQRLLKTAHRAQLSASDPRDFAILCGLNSHLTLDEMDGILMERDIKPLMPEQKKLSEVLGPLMGGRTLAQLLQEAGLNTKVRLTANATIDTLLLDRSDLIRIGFALHLPSAKVQSVLRTAGFACLSRKKDTDKQIIDALDSGKPLDEVRTLL